MNQIAMRQDDAHKKNNSDVLSLAVFADCVDNQLFLHSSSNGQATGRLAILWSDSLSGGFIFN